VCAFSEFDGERPVIVGGDDVAHPRAQLAGRTRGLDVCLLVDLLQIAGQHVGLEREDLEQQAQWVLGLRVGAFHDVTSSDVS
jgi:hypothetical protein